MAPSATAPRAAERRFYLGFSVVLALAVFLGFARTFFLRAWYPAWAAAHGAPESIFYLHGALRMPVATTAGWHAVAGWAVQLLGNP